MSMTKGTIMLRQIYLMCVASSAFTLASCASSSPAATSPSLIDVQPDETSGVLTVLRDNGTKPYAATIRVTVNGDDIGRLKNGEYLRAALPPGRYFVEFHFKKLLMIDGPKFYVTLKAGEEYPVQVTDQIDQVGPIKPPIHGFYADHDILALARSCCEQVAAVDLAN